MQTKLSLIVILGLLTVPAIARADSLSLGQIAQELKQEAVIPLAPSEGTSWPRTYWPRKLPRRTRSSKFAGLRTDKDASSVRKEL